MTIQQYASFDVEAAGFNATSKTNPALTKLVKIWESKNAKRAMKGSGFTLMAVSLAACGGSDDVVVDITSDNAAAIAAATPAIVASAEAAEFADIVASVNASVGSALDATTATGDDVIAAIQGAVDITTDNAALIAAAEAAVDITTDNAALIAAAEAAATTAALTATDLTIYANVDAAKTAGSLISNGVAVTAALTDASNVVHSTVDVAIASNDAAIALAATNAATAAAEATLVTGTGYSSVSDIVAE